MSMPKNPTFEKDNAMTRREAENIILEAVLKSDKLADAINIVHVLNQPPEPRRHIEDEIAAIWERINTLEQKVHNLLFPLE